MENHKTKQVVDELIFTMPLKKIENADKYIGLAADMGVSTRIIPDWQLYYEAGPHLYLADRPPPQRSQLRRLDKYGPQVHRQLVPGP